jgi:soluble lytic murein transglycosylase
VIAQSDTDNKLIIDAREALRNKDATQLAALRNRAIAVRHPLAMWADYWELNNRLYAVGPTEVEAFYQRWPNTYVEDRLRNDFLLELGRRRDWKALLADYARFKMNDDRQVNCYVLMADYTLNGKDVKAAARTAWFAQREPDEGCQLLATTLYEAKVLTDTDAWKRARAAVDANKPAVARHAVLLAKPDAEKDVATVLDSPARFLGGKTFAVRRSTEELATLALMRLASNDPEQAAQQLNSRWERMLPADLAAWAWASVARQSAFKLLPDASSQFLRAAQLAEKAKQDIDWTDDTLAWKARAALRGDNGSPRWTQVLQAIGAMSATEQKEHAWVYWKARALQALAAPEPAVPEAASAASGVPVPAPAPWREMMAGIANPLTFYGALANEELGRPQALPASPQPPSAEERAFVVREPGLNRALLSLQLGLRSEGEREWNFTMRGLNDRQLLASAWLACDRGVWDRCVSSSERTRSEIELNQRYPTPYRTEIVGAARAAGLDPALVYGLIRQESRFRVDIKSSANAYGLMQVIPPTARNIAKRANIPYDPTQITDVNTNLRIGTYYLKLLLDDFGGAQPLAIAGYNAGPNRPRRWREGPVTETAIWVENIPFSETRDYVKKVLTNATIYSALMAEPNVPQGTSLKTRLGKTIGPRPPQAPVPDGSLP